MRNLTERVSQRIDTLAKAAGLSDAELSKLTGIPRSSIQRYRSGYTKKIPLDHVPLIAAALHTTAEALLGWDGTADQLDRVVTGLTSLDKEIITRLARLSTEDWKKVDSFVQGILASR